MENRVLLQFTFILDLPPVGLFVPESFSASAKPR